MVAGASAAAFVAMAIAAATSGGPFSFDVHIASWVSRVRTTWLTSAMQVVTNAGSAVALLVVVVAAAVLGTRRRDLGPTVFIAATGVVAWIGSQLFKALIARPRPAGSLAVGTFSSYAFPSGHATTAAALWGSVAWLLSRRIGARRRWTALAGWITVMVLVDASRVELGAHWTSDVVAGSLLGTAVVAGAVLLTRPHPPRAERYLTSAE